MELLKNINLNNNRIILFGIIALKIIALILFSSDYQNKLFIPFVDHFLSNFDNPWQYFFENQLGVEFPYPPFMLYILSFFYLPCHFFSISQITIQNIFFKMPIILSDIFIFWILNNLITDKTKKILIFYFSSPIIIYASYMHSQLDIIPTALLLLSIYCLLKNNLLLSSVVFGLSLSTKFHVLAALPLILVYIIKKNKIKDLAIFIIIPTFIYLFLAYPYIFSDGYYSFVLSNPKQMLIFEVIYNIGALKIYLPLLIGLVLYSRFFMYDKINNDLFLAFLTMLFGSLVFIIVPAPGWYIWMLPFFSILFIKIYDNNKKIIYVNFALSGIYLLFFVFFYIPDHQDLIFINTPINMKIDNERLRNFIFTMLEAILIGSIYLFYKFGIRSNTIYKQKFATVIGISGDSGVGKSTLLSDIKLLFGEKLVELEGDGDHKWERGDVNWKQYTHLNPKANFLHKQSSDILSLKSGKQITRIDYNHHTGKFTEERIIKPENFIILCGLHTFYLPKMRKIIDLKLFLDTDDKLRKHWKIKRDMVERGYFAKQVLEQLEVRKKDSEKYIQPQKNFADIIIKYFSDDDFDIDKIDCDPHVKLQVTLDSNLHIEGLISAFMDEGIDIFWDYDDDLQKQYIIFEKPVSSDILENIANSHVLNIEELIDHNIVWSKGYRGFIQLIILLSISEKIKNDEIIINGDSL